MQKKERKLRKEDTKLNKKKKKIRTLLLFPVYLPLNRRNETIHIFLYTHLINNKRTYAKKTKKREREREIEGGRQRKKNRWIEEKEKNELTAIFRISTNINHN